MINKVILIGYVGKEPEIRSFQNDNKVANFSLATSENYKDKSGEWQSKSEWHNITAWNNLAERCANIVKGDLLYIEGKIKTEKYQTNEGQDRYTTKIIAGIIRKINKGESQTNKNNLQTQQEKSFDKFVKNGGQDLNDLPF